MQSVSQDADVSHCKSSARLTAENHGTDQEELRVHLGLVFFQCFQSIRLSSNDALEMNKYFSRSTEAKTSFDSSFSLSPPAFFFFLFDFTSIVVNRSSHSLSFAVDVHFICHHARETDPSRLLRDPSHPL